VEWANGPFFVYMDELRLQQMTELLEPTVTGLGYELVGIEFAPVSGRNTLRVYIDSEQGVGVDDCQVVSRQISGLLDVEDPIDGAYALEISSPGIERPLFKTGDYERFSGQKAKIQLKEALHGRKNFTGLMQGIDDGVVLMDIDGEQWRLPLTLIRRAKLAPDY